MNWHAMNSILFCVLLLIESLQPHDDICHNPDIDALVTGQQENELYVFNGNLFWKYNYDRLALSKPRTISDIWIDVPTPIDAADVIKYSDHNYYMIFLKDNSYWMYESVGSIEIKPNLVSSGDIGTQFQRRIEALQISPYVETNEGGIKIIASICDEDNKIYDCIMNTTTRFYMGNCLVYPNVISIFPEQHCKGLTYLNATTTIISGLYTMVSTNASRLEVFDEINIKTEVFQCISQLSNKIAIPVVAGCGMVVIINAAIIAIVFKQRRSRVAEIKDKE